MSDDERLNALVARLTSFKAGPDRPIDFALFKDPQWKEKLLKEGLPHLYQQFGESFPVIQELCGLYVKANPEQQAAARAAIAKHKDAVNALNQYSPSLATGASISHEAWKAGYEAFKSQDFDGWLRLLVTALALKLALIDYRDDIMAINHLEREAQQRGVDFAPYREELIRLSDPASAKRVGLHSKST